MPSNWFVASLVNFCPISFARTSPTPLRPSVLRQNSPQRQLLLLLHCPNAFLDDSPLPHAALDYDCLLWGYLCIFFVQHCFSGYILYIDSCLSPLRLKQRPLKKGQRKFSFAQCHQRLIEGRSHARVSQQFWKGTWKVLLIVAVGFLVWRTMWDRLSGSNSSCLGDT